MTEDFCNMLCLLGNSVNNCGHKIKNTDIKKIREMAISQGTYALVYPELEKICDMRIYTNEFLSLVADGIKRNAFYIRLLDDMRKEGIGFCLLKGASVSRFYPVPEYRISGDTDILIDPADEEKVQRFLEKQGCIIEERDKNEHHFKAFHKTGGLMEVHIRLYSIPAQEILFEGKDLYNEEYSHMNVDGYTMPILGINDGLIYLTAHYIKHFVSKGGGVRQMLDLLVYIEHYKDKINFDRFYSILKDLRYDKLFSVITSIGAKYWGFNYPIEDEGLVERILTDCEEGGIFGEDNNTRNGFNKLYYSRRSLKNPVRHKYFMATNAEKTVMSRIFVGQKGLQLRGYSYARNRILVPLAWLHRFFDEIINGLKKRNHSTGYGKEFKKRIELMQDLNMID